jgi:hypothetical protein
MSLSDANLRALGGQGGNVSGGNGSLILKPLGQAYGDLIIDGQSATTPHASSPIPPGYVFDNILLRNNARVVADDPLKVNGSLRVLSGSILTHSLSSEEGLTIRASRVEVDATSAIDVSAKGYRGGLRDGNALCEGITLGGLPGAISQSGGSYGGVGGVYNSAGTNAPYGHPEDARYLGSGGSCGPYSRAGGNGGGLVRITASDAVVVQGSILANGGTGVGYQAGSGSGGSIKIETSLLCGIGTIAANGGANEVGGGGGRVAITYDYFGESGENLNGLRNITAFGGHGGNAWGSAGTVLLKRNNQQHGDLYIDDNMTATTSSVYTPLTHIGFGRIMDLTDDSITTDGWVKMVPNGLVGLEINPNLDQGQTFTVVSNTENTITVDTALGPDLTDVAKIGDAYAGVYRFDNVYFRRGGFLVLGERLVVTDTLRVDEYGRVTHYDATRDGESRLDLTVGRLEITATGSINVDERGYLGGGKSGNDCSGQTVGNTDGSTSCSGGSYGGLGGDWAGVPNPTYGSLTAPADLGSGGGCGPYGRIGGDGGGWVKILAQEILMNGLITANGGIGNGYQAGSGSGGTISITTSSLSGTGIIQANGGGGEVGGGGGRVAVTYHLMSLSDANLRALGGQGGNVSGQQGSVYPKAN